MTRSAPLRDVNCGGRCTNTHTRKQENTPEQNSQSKEETRLMVVSLIPSEVRGDNSET